MTEAAPDTKKRMCSLYLTAEAIRMLDEIARTWGISRSSALEITIRESYRAKFPDDQ